MLMQVRRSVNLHESSAPAENVLRDTTGSLCESDVVKNENAHNLHHAFLGHYFQTLKNLSPLLKITAMPPPKKDYVGLQQFIFSPHWVPPKNVVIKTWWIAFTLTLVCNPSRQRPQTYSSALGYVGVKCAYSLPRNLSYLVIAHWGTIKFNQPSARSLIPKAITILLTFWHQM